MKKLFPSPMNLIRAFIIMTLFIQCSSSDKPIIVILQSRIPNDSLSVKWSPKGEKLPLALVEQGLAAEIRLGPENLDPVKLILFNSPESVYPNRLTGDWNRSGDIEDDSIICTTPMETRGKIWSSFNAMIDIPVRDPVSGRQEVNSYPLSFWYVYDPVEPNAEKVIRFSRRGWMEGVFQMDTISGLILLTEMQMDGVYDTLDSWNLSFHLNPNELYGSGSRSCMDHAWLGNRAFKLAEIDQSGRQVSLIAFDPGISKEEEEKIRDILSVDRLSPRSGKTVSFLPDYLAAMKKASRQKKALFIDFETTWCGPCKLMDQWVYSADQVVDKSVDIVAVKVDGDDNRDLVRQFKVSSYPTLILVGHDGKEIRRATGYQSVSKMVAFLTL
jgi:thiol-disulfide isomerase/thioredoxin